MLSWFFVVAATGGCLYWLALPLLGWRTLRAMSSLGDVVPDELERWPRVSLIIPACNEAADIEAAVRSRLAEDYPDLEIVLVDDRSTDATGAIIDRLAAEEPRIRAIHVRTLPDDWLGKNHAQHVGAQAATGEWLVFTDADVHQEPGTLRRAVTHARERRADFLAVFPDAWSNDFLLDTVLGVFSRGFSLTMRVWAVEDPDSSAYVGVGAFNMVRAEALADTPGLPWLALDVGDDVALGKLMKVHGKRCSIINGHGFVGLDWYRSIGEMAVGFEKNAWSVVGHFSLTLLVLKSLAMVLMESGPLLAVLPGMPAWLVVLGWLAIASAVSSTAVFCRLTGRPFLATLLGPVGALIMAWILIRAGVLGRRRGGVLWRGTLYPDEQLKGRMRVML